MTEGQTNHRGYAVTCEHKAFEVHVAVILNSDQPGVFTTGIQVRCADCRTRFRWVDKNLQMGLDFSGVAVSADWFELRCPIEPDAYGTSMLASNPGLGFPA